MAPGNRDKPDRIGIPDPTNEPLPPKIDDAGELGEVGARKLDERQKDAVWKNRPPTPDQDPEAEPRR
jgi:hypothetical protein